MVGVMFVESAYIWEMVWPILIIAGVLGALAIIPSNIAKQRGYSFWKFWFISFFLTFCIGLIVVYCNPDISKRRIAVPCLSCGAKVFPNVKNCTQCGAAAPPPVYADAVPEAPFEPRNRFVGNWAGILLMAAALAVALGLGSTSEWFFSDMMMLSNFAAMLVPSVAVAMGVVLTARAAGPDFSLPALIGLSAAVAAKLADVTGSAGVAVTVALLACAAFGAVNGALMAFTRLPAIVATVITGIAAAVITPLVSIPPWCDIRLGFPLFTSSSPDSVPVAAIVIILAMALITFALVMFTRLSGPMRDLPDRKQNRAIIFTAHIISALFTAAAGLFLLARIGTSAAGGSFYSIADVLFVFIAISCIRLADNKWAAVPWALFLVLVYTLLQLMMIVKGIAQYGEDILLSIFALVTLGIAIDANRDAVKRMGRLG